MSTIGRPTKYKVEYCQQLIGFFDIDPFIDVPLEHFDKDGNLKWTDYKRVANRMPTVRGFCKSIQITPDTFYRWVKEHKAFSDAFTQAKDLQKWFLIENGLNGCYNPAFAIFTAKNITDMRDKTETEVTAKLPFQIVIKRKE